MVGTTPLRDTGLRHRHRVAVPARWDHDFARPHGDPFAAAPTSESLPAWAAPVPLAARAELATKDYGRGDTAVRALDAVTVGLPAERFTAVMGPSGSGKSTLMHCLAGLDTLTSGRAFIGDVDLGTCPTAS